MKRYIYKWGSLTGVGFITYFLLMASFGLTHVIELRLLNFVILLAGIAFTVWDIYRQPQYEFTYFQGFVNGYAAGAFGILMFIVFFILYINVFDPNFIASIKDKVMFSQYINNTSAAAVLFIEGYASCFFATYTVMQYMKAKTPKINA